MTKLGLRPNVCLLISNSEGKLFLGEREGSPGVWQFPQGGIEPGHTAEHSALKEASEEMGVDPDKLVIVCRLEHRHEYEFAQTPEYAKGKWRGQSQTFWCLRYLGNDSEINVSRFEPEFRDWRWCSPEEVRRLAEPRRLQGYLPALEEYERRAGKIGP